LSHERKRTAPASGTHSRVPWLWIHCFANTDALLPHPMNTVSYVLVTPVRDEVATIARTIASVTRQTLQPSEWIVVSDGSIDGTNEVVEAATRVHDWIRLLSLPSRPGRSFAAVVHNTEAGVNALKCHDYQYLGLLDADVAFKAEYFETLISRFEANPRLGLAGGVVIDRARPKNRFPRNRIDVPGAVQLFRRDCFERLGGLVAIPEGGWDSLTCAMARMSGFETQLFTDLMVDHLKPRNISQGGPLRRMWQLGVRDYALGYDPFFELFKCMGRVTEPPFLAAALARWVGFCAATVRRRHRVVPRQVIAFVQREQRRRLRSLWDGNPRAAADSERLR
jgi:poly-beta-1,6-N-acetyl-D-glucosamine synthase